PECGAKQVKTCANCGTEIKASAKFCSECGEKIVAV
ncbi:MAG: zinc-ribbon domain-containing protein, partial [Clostridia bacterium]